MKRSQRQRKRVCSIITLYQFKVLHSYICPFFWLNSYTAQLQWVNSSELWKTPSLNNWRPDADMVQYFNDTTEIKQNKNYFQDAFLGTLSDTCISQAFHCETQPITSKCKEYFFTQPKSSYTLNHHILYFIIAEQVICRRSLFKTVKPF